MVVVANAKETLGENKKAAKNDGGGQAGNFQAYDGKHNVSYNMIEKYFNNATSIFYINY